MLQRSLATSQLVRIPPEWSKRSRLYQYGSSSTAHCPPTRRSVPNCDTITGIALIDNNGVRKADAFFGSGRLLGTLTTSSAGASTESTVCGPLDTVTSFFLCNRPGIYINSVYSRLCVRH